MTALHKEAIRMVEQMPEEQMPYVIQYMNALQGESLVKVRYSGNDDSVSTKMSAFLELEQMISPLSEEIDYDMELAEAREEKYGCVD